MNKVSFEIWLKRQIKRDDPVGDLANDFAWAKKSNLARGQKCNKEHLDKWNACPEAYDALKEAMREYKKFIKSIEKSK